MLATISFVDLVGYSVVVLLLLTVCVEGLRLFFKPGTPKRKPRLRPSIWTRLKDKRISLKAKNDGDCVYCRQKRTNWSCSKCGTVAHKECINEMGSTDCPTRGCI